MSQEDLDSHILSYIRYTNERTGTILSGIQLYFENGFTSPFFGTSEKTTTRVIRFDTSREIRYVSMLVHLGTWYYGIGVQYYGIAFYDSNNDLIVRRQWAESDWNEIQITWTDKQMIPEGQHIIGLRC